MTNFNAKTVRVTGSEDGNAIVRAGALAEFCAELEATPPFSALWWPEKTELNELALWNCIDSKYGNLAEERRSAFDIQFVLAKPHHVSPDGTKWITERSGALKFEVVETTTPGTTLFLAVSFAE